MNFQTCSWCGYIYPQNKKTECPYCGYKLVKIQGQEPKRETCHGEKKSA